MGMITTVAASTVLQVHEKWGEFAATAFAFQQRSNIAATMAAAATRPAVSPSKASNNEWLWAYT